MINIRKIALEILNEIYKEDAYANLVLNKYLKKYNLSDLDRRFLTELVYGVVKAGDTLIWMIGEFSKIRPKKMELVVLNILRLGVYQLAFMDKVPDSAACNESTQLAKTILNKGAGNFVNGILRNIIRNRDKIALPTGNKAYEIALREQHPAWLVKYFIEKLNSVAALKLCQFNNTNAPLIVRVNTLKLNRDEAVKELIKCGCKCQILDKTPEGILIQSHPNINLIKPIWEGQVQIQDISSMIVAHVVSPKEGDFVIDTCAAPGGKSTHMAALMNNKGRILAVDIYDHKLELIKENSNRLGISIIETEKIDARTIGEEYEDMADCVLVDAPCSGLGVLRRKVDARWHKKIEDIKKLPELQYEILESASKSIKQGGTLVYSTCTIIRDENDAIVEKFLSEHKEFSLLPINESLPYTRNEETKTLQLLPHVDNCDGFFIAKMVRNK